jgi:hypothetical protein
MDGYQPQWLHPSLSALQAGVFTGAHRIKVEA